MFVHFLRQDLAALLCGAGRPGLPPTHLPSVGIKGVFHHARFNYQILKGIVVLHILLSIFGNAGIEPRTLAIPGKDPTTELQPQFWFI